MPVAGVWSWHTRSRHVPSSARSAAPGWQGIADPMEGLANASDIAVTKDRPDAFDEALAILVI